MYIRGLFTLLLLLAVLTVFGCSSGDSLDRASLTGTVMFNGKPLDHGMIGLLPVDGTRGPQGTAAIKTDGTYEVITAGKPGAVVGTHKIVVQCREMLSPEERRAMKIGRSLVPAQYTNYDNTPLKVEIPQDGTVFNIKLTR